MEKPRSPKSKGYGNLGRGSPKYLAKAHEIEELECARDAQGNEIGWGCPKKKKGPKELESDEMGQGSPK